MYKRLHRDDDETEKRKRRNPLSREKERMRRRGRNTTEEVLHEIWAEERIGFACLVDDESLVVWMNEQEKGHEEQGTEDA